MGDAPPVRQSRGKRRLSLPLCRASPFQPAAGGYLLPGVGQRSTGRDCRPADHAALYRDPGLDRAGMVRHPAGGCHRAQADQQAGRTRAPASRIRGQPCAPSRQARHHRDCRGRDPRHGRHRYHDRSGGAGYWRYRPGAGRAENGREILVGSVTVVADRPIQVGDFCQVGDVLGTVEDIGIRSTRIRTLARTIVTIPNGDFSSRQIENYSQRDRFFFNPVIGLEYGISAAQLRNAIAIIEDILVEHPLIAEDSRRARLDNFGASSLNIEVFAYIEVTDYAESLNYRQELLMTIFERLEEAGLSIAYPAQTLYLRRGDAGRD